MAKKDEYDAAEEFGPISDWKSTMPVWAHQQLNEIRSMEYRWDPGQRPSGPIVGGWMTKLPCKVLDGILLPPVRLYVVRVTCAGGYTSDLCLYPDDDYKRWHGETPDERGRAKWPNDDVITGWPDHYIVNGDPSSCACPEHLCSDQIDNGGGEF